MNARPALICAAIIANFLSTARSETIDFSSLSSGNSGLSSLVLGRATIEVPDGSIFVYRPGDFGAFNTSGGLCALASGTCQTDWLMTFSTPITNFSFEAAFYNDFDSVRIEAFNGAASVGVINVNSEGIYSFGAAQLTSLRFDDSSAQDGFGFGDFNFAPVPEPTQFALLSVGLLVIGSALSRRRGRLLRTDA